MENSNAITLQSKNQARSPEGHDCAAIGEDSSTIQMGELFRCFARPVTRYIPRAGEEVATTYLVSSEDIWYRFKWHSIFGYEMDVVVNPDNGLVSLANRLGDELEGAETLPTYAVQISDYGHSDDRIGFVVRAGGVESLDNGAIVIDDEDVEIHFASGDMITGKELVKAIRMLLRELGVDRTTLASAAAAVQTELLRKTPDSIGALSNTISDESGIGKILDSL